MIHRLVYEILNYVSIIIFKLGFQNAIYSSLYLHGHHLI